ncbi:uncharacterized protein I206_101621 [Kwoniella pini CBS 10737]|uniref:Uncharacterized protein n=1 Tax=Kwoniella pini CBS 10737 TaxID=1296096 RepID=A0A1B9HW88_9TREE|nr:uncharacterized protein I206_06409 [Kwoniella pini CBS 10737]OCF47508.1 hypothetical protein I206_06409 [Kwoniella pini CBS 10737]
MPGASGSQISLSSAHIYTLQRDPNLPPPIRSNHLPISSQTSPDDSISSSPAKILTSSNEVEIHVDGMGDEDEFAGLEMMGLTQWEREVPSSTRKASDRKERAEAEEQIDELDESDLERPFDLVQSAEEDVVMDDQVANHSSIAAHSSPPLRTPAFSLPSLNSDIPSGPYPQTPQTAESHRHNHQILNPNVSTPLSWSHPHSPSPLSSRDRSDPQTKRSLMILSDDSDMEDVDKENQDSRLPGHGCSSQASNKSNRKGKGKQLAESEDDEEPLALKKRKRGRMHKLIESDEENEEPLSVQRRRRVLNKLNDEEEDEPLAVQQRRREKGKQKDISPGGGYEGEISFDYDFTEDILENRVDDTSVRKDTLDDLFKDDENYEYDQRGEEQVHKDIQQQKDEEDLFDFDQFGDFPFDQIDLELANSNNKSQNIIKSKIRLKSKSKSPQKERQLHNNLFPSDEVNVYKHHDKSNFRDDDEMINRYFDNPEWNFPLISDLNEKWQDFYKNHWRRGVDKLKSTSKQKENQKNMRIGGILSEDEESEEERWIPPTQSIAKKITNGSIKRGPWGLRGRGRGAWRGRGGVRARGRTVKRK